MPTDPLTVSELLAQRQAIDLEISRRSIAPLEAAKAIVDDYAEQLPALRDARDSIPESSNTHNFLGYIIQCVESTTENLNREYAAQLVYIAQLETPAP